MIRNSIDDMLQTIELECRFTQRLPFQKDDVILEVGCGCGCQAALLSLLLHNYQSLRGGMLCKYPYR